MKTNRRKFMGLSVLMTIATSLGLVAKPKPQPKWQQWQEVLISRDGYEPFATRLRNVQKHDNFKIISTKDDPMNNKQFLANSDAYQNADGVYTVEVYELA